MGKHTSISIVTVSMNRKQHLAQSAAEISKYGTHVEHVIVDWSSEQPISKGDLPDDKRIKLFRVESEERWWLTRAYNFAISRCTGDFVAKVDADVLLGRGFFEALDMSQTAVQISSSFFIPAIRSTPELSGLFMISKEQFYSVGGFSEYLRGWGWDETDLFTRLLSQGEAFKALDLCDVASIRHNESDSYADRGFSRSQCYSAIKAANNAYNKKISECVRWSNQSTKSIYKCNSFGQYVCVSLPPPVVIEGVQRDDLVSEVRMQYLMHVSVLGELVCKYMPLAQRWMSTDPLSSIFDNPLVSCSK